MKKLPGASSASWWWLRSAYNYSDFYGVTYSGDWSYYNAYFAGGVVVGFCIETRSKPEVKCPAGFVLLARVMFKRNKKQLVITTGCFCYTPFRSPTY